MGRKNIHDEDEEFEEDGEDLDQEDELAKEGYFVENEDGMEEGKKGLDLEGEEAYFLDHSDGEGGAQAELLDDYSDHLEDEDEEDGEDAEEDH